MLVFSEDVKRALFTGRGVVALESTIITHGMPYPENLETALMVEKTVRDNGAVPATIAIINGVVHVGLTEAQLKSLATCTDAIKVSRRDISQVISKKQTGSTTVAATMIFSHMAGISVFATGGIGGVHRGAEMSFDISADITELGRTPVLVVSAGAKSILDLPKTMELLETAGVSVIGFRTDEFPAFFTNKSSLKTSARCESEAEVASVLATHKMMNLSSGLLLTCPVPEAEAGDGDLIERATQEAVAEAIANRVGGKEITPFLLKRINEKTKGKSLKANIALIKNNAAIAARVSVALALGPSVANRCSGTINIYGGICVDTTATPSDVDVSGETKSSYPGRIRTSIGGVCRNIAQTVHQLGGDVVFTTVCGSDASAATDMIRNHAENNRWISLKEIPQKRSGQYLAVMNGDGSLCSAVIDMDVIDSWVPEVTLSAPSVAKSQVVLFDTNLSKKAILNLASETSKKGFEVWVDCVSVVKCVRLLSALPFIDVVKANLDELATLAAVTPLDSTDNIDDLIAWVAKTCHVIYDNSGGNTFVVSCGRLGVVLVSRDASKSAGRTIQLSEVNLGSENEKITMSCIHMKNNLSVLHYAVPVLDQVVDSTGAGDCLIGATCWARFAQKISLQHAIFVGICAARLTLMSHESVSPEIIGKRMDLLVSRLRLSVAKL